MNSALILYTSRKPSEPAGGIGFFVFFFGLGNVHEMRTNLLPALLSGNSLTDQWASLFRRAESPRARFTRALHRFSCSGNLRRTVPSTKSIFALKASMEKMPTESESQNHGLHFVTYTEGCRKFLSSLPHLRIAESVFKSR